MGRVVRPGPEFLELLIAVSRQADSRGNLMFDAQIAALTGSEGLVSDLLGPLGPLGKDWRDPTGSGAAEIAAPRGS